MITRRHVVQGLASAALPTVLAGRSHAQPLQRQLTIVVAFPPGGATDAVARLLAQGMRDRYAEIVVVDNRAGAAGRIGTDYVKRAPADGSVMLFSSAFPLVIFPHIYKNLPYDALKDFIPVATTTRGAFALSVGPAVPASVRTLHDFVAWCKAHPDAATFGAPAGAAQHFAGAQFSDRAGIPLRLISYKGGAPTVVDVLGGHLASVVNPIPEVLPLVMEGKLRMLATTTARRTRFTPDVPTFSELGHDVIFQDWSGLVAPTNTPREWIARANEAVGEVMRTPAVVAALDKLGSEIELSTPEQFAVEYRRTWERYREVVGRTGFTATE